MELPGLPFVCAGNLNLLFAEAASAGCGGAGGGGANAMAGAVFKFETSDGHTLSYESWSSANQASAGTPITVVFLHGVHESADTLVMTQAHYRDCCACLSLMDVLFTPDAEHAPPTNARDHQTARDAHCPCRIPLDAPAGPQVLRPRCLRAQRVLSASTSRAWGQKGTAR